MVSAIVLAAGKGKRMNSTLSKPLLRISGKPLIVYSLEAFNRHSGIDEIILVISPKNRKAIEKEIKNKFKKIKGIVLGGRRRQDSVKNGLNKLSPESNLVLIHDCARPFIKAGFISKLIASAKKFGAAIPGVPVKATIKSVKSGMIEKTLDRKNLWEIQTPQVFRKSLIQEAYSKFSKAGVTDDSSLVEKLAKAVKIVRGSYNNIKVTTQEDLLIAETISKDF